MPGGEAARALGLAALVVGGMLVYGLTAWLTRLARPAEIKALMRGR